MPADLVLRFPPRGTHSLIRFGPLERLGRLTAATGAVRVVVVSDTRVARLYAPAALRSLRAAGLEVALVTVPPGEGAKRTDRLDLLWRRFGAAGLARRDAVVALGGGVIGDLAGFAAATWMRGVSWVCVPTTVVAQVDSAIGGKTAIDLPVGKNLAGAFHQPAAVLVDARVLRSLPARERRAGLAEVVKTGFAADASLFRWAEGHATALEAGDPAALRAAAVRSIRVKGRIVTRDERERERGARAALNFGHTLGHALEVAHGYRGLKHGEAVAIGMRVAARLSEREAGLPAVARERLDTILDALRLPRRIPATRIASILEAMAADKKRRGGVRWVLTPRVGHASVPRLLSGRLVRAVLLDAGATA